jgi:hypothetical protein
MATYVSCIDRQSPAMPRTRKARVAAGVKPCVAASPERSRRPTRNSDAITHRSIVRNTGGKSRNASLAIAG